MSQSLLTIKDLTMQFGGLTAVSDVNMHVENDELVGLIGPNGAGKTTLFNVITGVYDPTEGEVLLNTGEETVSLGGKRPDQVNNLGIGRTFQNIRLFGTQTVLNNILIALNSKKGAGVLTSILRLPNYYRNRDELYRIGMELLKKFDLEDVADEQANALPYGQQRRVEIVRALATEPKLIFLDEPAAGMNPHETEVLRDEIRRIRDEFHVAVVLIEHDMSLVMNVCERIYVLNHGKLIAEGTPDEIQNNQEVIDAYLGGVK